MRQISARQLSDRLNDNSRDEPILLDVREPWEFDVCRISGSKHIPMRTVPARITELDPEREVIVICHHGARSYQVGIFLERQGFSDVLNLSGGVAAWAHEVDPTMRQY
jgi:rhodanese-related sulfurtransferase